MLTVCLWESVGLFQHIPSTLIKTKIKFSSHVRKFRIERLQSHKRLTALVNICAFPHILGSPSSYMTLQPLPSEFPYLWGKFRFLFNQCTVQHQGANQSQHCSACWQRDTVYRCIQKYAKLGLQLCCSLCWSIFITRGWADQKRIYGLFGKGCGGSCPIKNSLKCTKFPPSTYFYGK